MSSFDSYGKSLNSAASLGACSRTGTSACR